MLNHWRNFKFRIGMRNIKTAITATLVALVYLLIGRDPTFACIGVVFGTGSNMKDSWLNGGNRLFGTIIGGFIGIALNRLYMVVYPDSNPKHFLMLGFLFVGIVILIIACQFFKWPGGIQPGGVVLCIILFTKLSGEYIPYTLNRMLDTGIGVVVALLVSYFFPRKDAPVEEKVKIEE